MKTHTACLLLPILGLGLITLPGLRAQDQGSAKSPSTNAPCHGDWKQHHREFANLTDAERQELKAAMEQIKENNQLQAAHAALRQAMDNLRQTRNQLLLQVDPNIQPILDKINAAEPPAPPAEPPPAPAPAN